MPNKILQIDSNTLFGEFIAHSLEAEGYQIDTVPSLFAAHKNVAKLNPQLVLVNGVGQPADWIATAQQMSWSLPLIILTEQAAAFILLPTSVHLLAPFAFQDLLLLVQDMLYQRSLGHKPLQFSEQLLHQIDAILNELRESLRARTVILSSSSGRLIKTAGIADQGISISLAALMSAGFEATAQAAQLLGEGDMFDSSLQESEGYGVYAIRLHEKLIISVAFSDKITIGMVRHFTAQAAVDILELLVKEAEVNDSMASLGINAEFRTTVNEALSQLLEG